ncbi:MAG TPA: Ig-like domain-containing protein [Longimicrobium sp.]|nr:Ig-like domain-containing protein [Longimicrobium sp.]
MKRILAALLFTVLGVAACKDSTGSGPRLSKLVVAPGTVFLSVGDTARLSALGTRQDDDEDIAAKASYKSSNNSVATVSSDGKVTAVAVGTAQITATSGGQTATVTVNVVATPNIRTFNVESVSDDGCSGPEYVQARLVATTANVLLYEDVANPAGGFTAAEYQAIANEFQTVGYQTTVNNFGQPTDLDGNTRVIGLFTRAVNKLTPPGAGFVYGGFFYGRDLFPRVPKPGFIGCPGSNVGEMFYLLAPDPTGTINGHSRSKAYVRENTLSTLPHELQHLINASRRYYVNNVTVDETVWLDEGLSHVAEELAYYAKSGFAPRQNLGRDQVLTPAQLNNYLDYQDNNLGRLSTYLQDPQVNSPIANNDELETRGATWWLLRYLADRRTGAEQAFWTALANSNTSGIANLQNALGGDPAPQIRDWAVMTYTDDTGLPVEARFTEPSWNHRSIFQNTASGVYPLRVMTLNNGATQVNVQASSAAYYKFGVAPAGTADVRFTAAGGTLPGTCAATPMTVGQVVQVVLNTGTGFCLAGGVTGAEYVAIAFYGSTTSGANIGIQVSATGVIPPVGPPSPVREAPSRVIFPLDGFDEQTLRGGGLELRLRLRERRIAAQQRGIRTATPRNDLAAIEGPGGVTINVVRTK